MKSQRGVQIAKHGTYILLMLLFYVLQTTPRFLQIGGVQPVLVVGAALAMSIYEGEFIGGIYGALAGVLCDITSFSLFGYHGIALCICCVFMGLLVEYLMRPTIFTYLAGVFVSMIVIFSLEFLIVYGIWRLEKLGMIYLYKVLFPSLLTTLFSTLFYYLYRPLQKKFAKEMQRFTRN